MRQITLNRQLLGLEDLLFGTGTVTQNRANQVVTITEINAGNLPFDETRTLVEFAQDTNLEGLGNSVEAINNLNNNLDKLLIVEDNLPIINNVEAIKDSIVTLDTNILALQTIDTNMSSINTVEDNLPIINNVEAIKDSIVTLDTNILALQTIDTNMSSINTVEDNLPIINNVEAIKDSIVTLDTNILALQTIDTNMSSINTVEDNLPIINNVEAIKESIVTLDTNILALQTIDTNMSSINTVEDNLPIINNVEAIKESIVTLDTNILALQNIDTNMSSINTVEDNLPEVVSVAQNIVPNLTEILNVDTLAAQVTQDKSDVSSMKLLIETIYDTFDDRFLGTKIVDPTLDNDGDALIDGAMYFNTSSNTMKVYDVGTTTWYSIPQIYLSALLDVQLTSITSGNVLRWNGTKWINYTLSKSDVELNLVDNTADSTKNVLSSTKLTTARTINGVLFDGSANIIVSDSTAVKLTGNQTLDDIKTFNSSPIVPTPTANTQAVNKAYVDSKYSGFKNLIINGGFDIWQRGNGPFTGYNYGPDRWVCAVGTHNSSASGGNVGKSIIHIVNTVAESSLLLQAIELNLTGYNAPFNVGKTFTISIRYSSSTRIKPMVQFTTGTAGNSPVDIFSTPEYKGGSGTDEVVSWTFTVPNNCGATNNCALLAVIGESVATDCYIYSVQLEAGSVATPFEQRPIGLELSLCQRYYEVGFTKNYVAGTSGASTLSTQYKVTKRAAASCTYVAAAVAPTATERLDSFGFTTYRAGGTEQAFFWFASAEL